MFIWILLDSVVQFNNTVTQNGNKFISILRSSMMKLRLRHKTKTTWSNFFPSKITLSFWISYIEIFQEIDFFC